MRTLALRALALSAIFGLVACNGESGERAEGTTTTVRQEDTTETASPGLELDESDLEAALLSVEDLPPGYRLDPSTEDDDEPFCEGHDPNEDHPYQADLDAFFVQSDFGPFISHSVGMWASQDEAADYMAAVREAVESCGVYTYTEDDMEWERQLAPLSFGKYGDETVPAAISLSTEGFAASGHIVLIRHGAFVHGVGYLDSGEASIDQTTEFVELAERKVATALAAGN